TAAIDARYFHTIPVAAPTDEERAHPYLWRFWRHIPRKGGFTIYDRSWYGRVLVERIEGFCSEADWMRAYAEINDFEEQLAEHGGPAATATRLPDRLATKAPSIIPCACVTDFAGFSSMSAGLSRGESVPSSD